MSKLNTQQIPPEDLVSYLSCFTFYCSDCGSWFFLPLDILVYLMLLLECSGFVYEIYSIGGPSLYIYCVVYFCIDITLCTRSGNSFLTLVHFRWQTGTPLDKEHYYTLNVFPYLYLPLVIPIHKYYLTICISSWTLLHIIII